MDETILKVTFTLVTIIGIIISLELVKIASGEKKISNLNMISLGYFYALFPNSFGSLLILIGLASKHYTAKNLTDTNLNLLVWILCLISPIILLFIMSIIGEVFKVKRLNKKFRNAQISPPKSKSMFYAILLVFTGIALLSSFYVFKILNGIPLLKLFYLSPHEIEVSRYLAKFEFHGNPYIKNLTGTSLSVILSYICFVYLKSVRKSPFIILIWLINSVIAIFLLTYDYEKLPIITYFFGYALLYIFSYKVISKKFLITVFSILLLLAFALSFLAFHYKSVAYAFSINGPFGRYFIGQIVPLYYHIIYFPRVHPFLKGTYYPKFIALLFHHETIRSSKIVMNIFSSNKYAGYMNTFFIAEAYANWGWAGIFLSYFIVGFVYEIIYIFFLKLPKNPITLSLFAYNSIEFAISINGGFYDFVYNPGFFFSLVLLFILNFFYERSVTHGKYDFSFSAQNRS